MTQKRLILVGYFEDGDEALRSIKWKEFLSWLIFSRMALLHSGRQAWQAYLMRFISV
jgi:hypothetical protein